MKPCPSATHSFNPRPREGGDKAEEEALAAEKVSIHAPVKEATSVAALNCCLGLVSIHAPVKEATAELILQPPKTLFQSTPP